MKATQTSEVTHLKRVEIISNVDCSERQVGFNERLEHGKHCVRNLVDDIAGVLPDLLDTLDLRQNDSYPLGNTDAHASDVPQHTFHEVEVHATFKHSVRDKLTNAERRAEIRVLRHTLRIAVRPKNQEGGSRAHL
jgi:hypothetical protein